MKGLLFRYLRNEVSQKVVRSLIDKGVRQREGHTFETVFDLLDVIEKLEPDLGTTIENNLSSLDIKLIVNQVRTNRDRIIAQNLALAARKYFGIPIEFLGSVSYDNIIRKGLLQRKPLTAYYPYSQAFEELIEITKKISPQHQLGLGFSRE